MNTARIKLPHAVIVKAPGLLPMLYKVSELAAALSIPERTLRGWLENGAPHQRDGRDHLWVDGEQFAAWVKAQRRPPTAGRLGTEQAYCLRCRKPVTIDQPERRQVSGKLHLVSGQCRQCGSAIHRGVPYAAR